MSKKIIFACPTHFELHQMIIDNLKHYGFEVYSLCIDEGFKYKNGSSLNQLLFVHLCYEFTSNKT